MLSDIVLRGLDDRLSKGSNDACQLDDREHYRAYLAGRARLGLLIQQFEEHSTILDNPLVASVVVRCACLLVYDADEEIVEQSDMPDVDDVQNRSFARTCQRLCYRLESYFSKRILVRIGCIACALRFCSCFNVARVAGLVQRLPSKAYSKSPLYLKLICGCCMLAVVRPLMEHLLPLLM